jgi:hypothetical protein
MAKYEDLFEDTIYEMRKARLKIQEMEEQLDGLYATANAKIKESKVGETTTLEYRGRSVKVKKNRYGRYDITEKNGEVIEKDSTLNLQKIKLYMLCSKLNKEYLAPFVLRSTK